MKATAQDNFLSPESAINSPCPTSSYSRSESLFAFFAVEELAGHWVLATSNLECEIGNGSRSHLRTLEAKIKMGN